MEWIENNKQFILGKSGLTLNPLPQEGMYWLNGPAIVGHCPPRRTPVRGAPLADIKLEAEATLATSPNFHLYVQASDRQIVSTLVGDGWEALPNATDLLKFELSPYDFDNAIKLYKLLNSWYVKVLTNWYMPAQCDGPRVITLVGTPEKTH